MTIEQKLLLKLEPHAKRIKDGDGNDFDYLPAVLLQLMEEQKRQLKQLEDTGRLLDLIKNSADTVGVQSKAQVAAFESATQRKMEQMETAVKDMLTPLQNSSSSIDEKLAVFASAHAVHAIQTKENLSAIGLQIKSLTSGIQQSHLKLIRLLVAGLIGSTAMIGLAVAILLRH